MTINEHKTEFAGRPIINWEPGDPIETPTAANYRIETAYDLPIQDTNFLDKVKSIWQKPQPKPEIQWQHRFEAFLNTPNSQMVSGFVVGPWDHNFAGGSSAQVVSAIAAAHNALPNLKSLFIGDIIVEESEISWIIQCDLSPILNAYPALEHLGVRGSDSLSFGTLKHAALKSLIVESGGLPAEVVQQVANAQLPALEHLELWLGTDYYGGDTDIKDLQPILSGQRFPKLKYLGLRDSEMADRVAAAVATSPITQQIEELDLSMGNLSDVGAQALLASPAIAKLRKLNLSHHYCSDEIIAQFKALPIDVDVSEQLTPAVDDTTVYRFIAVSE